MYASFAKAISVIVVEDEADLREEVVDYLTDNGLSVRGVAAGAALDLVLREAPADIVVLDLGLPSEDGITIAERLRKRTPPVGIIMMTARTRVEERILGYDTGADIYLVKPVDFGELLAAIHATVRRAALRDPAPTDVPLGRPAGGLTWHLDTLGWRLVAPSGASLRLTRAETQALTCLTETPGEVVSRDDIALRMGKRPDLGEHRYVDQVISRLRRKISNELGWEAPIGSAHGQGYYFLASVQKEEP